MTGGYKIIDLYGLDLANMQLDSTKIEKIFNDIESTYKTKALLFDNYKINGINQNATFSSAIVKNSGFEITLGDYKLLIKTDSVADNTLHLYRHDLYVSFQDSGSNYAAGVITIYNTSDNAIEDSNLKDIIKANNDYGIIMVGHSGPNKIMSIYYDNDSNNYIITYDNDDVFYGISINNLNDSIIKIF